MLFKGNIRSFRILLIKFLVNLGLRIIVLCGRKSCNFRILSKIFFKILGKGYF